MSTAFFFEKSKYDVIYLCPQTKTHLKMLKNRFGLHVQFPFFITVQKEKKDSLLCCRSCYRTVENFFNFCEVSGDFSKCFQRYFLENED